MRRILSLSLTIALSLVSTVSKAQQCPDDPDKIRSMISELKDTFECSGLSLQSCNQYRSGVIGGALAGATAAGLALLKRNSAISCGIPGRTSAKLNSRHREDFLASLIFGFDAVAASGSACSIDKKVMVKEIDALKKDMSSEAKKIQSEMQDRMMAQRMPATDITKLEVTPEEYKKQFKSGLDALEKELKTLKVTDVAAKERLMEAVARAKDVMSSVSGKSVSMQMVDSYHNLVAYMPGEVRDALSAETMRGVQHWEIKDLVRADKMTKVPNTAALKAIQEVDIDLGRLSNLTNDAARTEYLASRGYKPDFIKTIIEVEDQRRSLGYTASSLQRMNYNLTTSSMRNAVSVSATEIRDLARRSGANFLSTPLFHFREVPGLNNGVVATVRRAGAAAIAKASAAGASKLGTYAKFAAPALMTAGKVMAAPVELFVEGLTFTNDADCRGQRVSQYGQVAMAENAKGNQFCTVSDQRTSKTDEFLFTLSPEEQLKEVRSDESSCQLLMRVHARYAPSQNWDLTCQGSTAQLNGKTAKGEGQMIRFSTDESNIENLEWYSGSFESCAKVSLKDGEFESAKVFDTETGMNGCGSVGTETTIGEKQLLDRRNSTDSKRMVKEFAEWQSSNAFVLSAASDCCQGTESAMCSKMTSRKSNNGRATSR